MQDFTPNSGSATASVTTWRLWLTILVLGSVFFFVDHDLGISRWPQFAPGRMRMKSSPPAETPSKAKPCP